MYITVHTPTKLGVIPTYTYKHSTCTWIKANVFGKLKVLGMLVVTRAMDTIASVLGL